MARLTGKVAIITGGAGGIGAATAKALYRRGRQGTGGPQRIGAPTRRGHAWQRGRQLRGGGCHPTSRGTGVCPNRARALPGYRHFAANAGIEGVVQPITDYPIDVFDQVMAVNVRGVWLGLKYAIPALRARGGGSIIITSSTAGIRGSVGLSAYTTSKHAVIGLMRTAALECAPWGIRVNTVNPAPIETRMMRSLEEMRQR